MDDVMINAIKFLSDPKVQQAPLSNRIDFLKGKGLSEAQIQEALQKSGSNATESIQATSQQQAPPIPVRPTEKKPNYLLGLAVFSAITVGLSYGIKNLLPYISFVSGAEIKKTTAEIMEKLKENEKSIEQTKLSTMDAVKAIETHSEQVSLTISEMSNLLDSYKAREEENKEELKKIQSNMDRLIESIPNLIEKTKDNHNLMLKEVQAELKSLKALMINRKIGLGFTNGTDPGSSSSQPFVPSFPGLNFNIKPVLPAWQLAAAQKVKNEEASSSEITEILDSKLDDNSEHSEIDAVNGAGSESDGNTDTGIDLPQ